MTNNGRASAIFQALGERLTQKPELAREVGAVLQFRLTEPEASWVINLKDTPSVHEGKADQADVTLRLSDEDLATLVQEPQAVQRLYQHGQLRVDGDGRMASRLGSSSQCTELVWQLRGQAEQRQVEGARVALQHNLGLGGACVVTLYRRD